MFYTDNGFHPKSEFTKKCPTQTKPLPLDSYGTMCWAAFCDLAMFFNRPGVAMDVLQTSLSNNNSVIHPFWKISSKRWLTQTVRAKYLKCWHNVPNPLRVMCHMSHVMSQVSGVKLVSWVYVINGATPSRLSTSWETFVNFFSYSFTTKKDNITFRITLKSDIN